MRGKLASLPMLSTKSIQSVGRFGFIVIILLSVVAMASAVRRTVSSVEILAKGWKPAEQADPFEDRYARRPVLSLVHSIAGILIIATGPFQFSATVRKRWMKLHRLCGRIFIVAGLVAATTAFIFLALLPVFGNFTSKTAMTFGGTYFFIAIIMAYIRIRQRRIQAHREWMIRSYALGLAIATLRVMLLILSSPPIGIPFVEAWDTVMWLGFVINAAIAEVWINLTRPGKAPSPVSKRTTMQPAAH